MELLTELLRRPAMTWSDALDIFVVPVLLYEMLLLIRGTRAAQMALSGGFILALFFLSEWLQLETVNWVIRNLGLPATSQGVFALRTPTTYAGVIEEPLLLLGTDAVPAGRTAQLDGMTTLLRDLDRPFEQDISANEPAWAAMRRVATFLREALTAPETSTASVGEAVTADAV